MDGHSCAVVHVWACMCGRERVGGMAAPSQCTCLARQAAHMWALHQCRAEAATAGRQAMQMLHGSGSNCQVAAAAAATVRQAMHAG
eukprot:359715-Chlamydomonas_euryale.AAC.6